MYQTPVESKILDRVKGLNGNQQDAVLSFLEKLPTKIHSTKIYRRKAMRQIREALNQSRLAG